MPRMGAFAGWLHHPAHALPYDDQSHCDVHGIRARRKSCMSSRQHACGTDRHVARLRPDPSGGGGLGPSHARRG
ncbi:hypothetical protein B5V01_13900 [Mesorhizobium erdmanii]|uniref:Uncharacterized protein n=1 Tax=Mesorhizobium erdmanii TaxID=1777866 RepID=A0A4V1P5S9_9HYPH|nr:hypothetical protein B5V01_13900 [Mesorhizobium erdmanii]